MNGETIKMNLIEIHSQYKEILPRQLILDIGY